MPVNLRGRCLLSLFDLGQDEVFYLLDLAADLKAMKRCGLRGRGLEGKNVVMIFDKTSTRTRCAFETAVSDEGGCCTLLTNSQMGFKESAEDTARVLGRYYDAILYRTDGHEKLKVLARYAGVPVWNGLSDLFHPSQVLADLLTVREKLMRPWRDLRLCFVGDARNNMANSLMLGCARVGMHYCAIAPEGLLPDGKLVEDVEDVAAGSGGSIEISSSLKSVEDADVVYTDVWASLGEEGLFSERIGLLRDYQVNAGLMRMTGKPESLFMHCLPAFHDTNTEIGRRVQREHGLEAMEVTDEVFRCRQSVVFDQAENRMHTARAIAVSTCGF